MLDCNDIRLLRSLENWLRTRSSTAWAKEFGHHGLMLEYATAIDRIIENSDHNAPSTNPND